MTKTITYALIEMHDDGTETVSEVTAHVIESREQLEMLLDMATAPEAGATPEYDYLPGY